MKKGDAFYAIIDGIECVGTVQYQKGEYFLCQDNVDGSECDDKMGWEYSYTVHSGKSSDLKSENVINFEIVNPKWVEENKEAYRVREIGKFDRYEVREQNNKFIFGCGEVMLSKDEIVAFVKVSRILEEKKITLSAERWKEVMAMIA